MPRDPLVRFSFLRTPPGYRAMQRIAGSNVKITSLNKSIARFMHQKRGPKTCPRPGAKFLCRIIDLLSHPTRPPGSPAWELRGSDAAGSPLLVLARGGSGARYVRSRSTAGASARQQHTAFTDALNRISLSVKPERSPALRRPSKPSYCLSGHTGEEGAKSLPQKWPHFCPLA